MPATFLVIWVAIGFSVLGSEMTEFVIGLWMLENQTLTDYVLIYVAIELPIFLSVPLIGFLIDKYNRFHLLLLAELVSGLLSITVIAIGSFAQVTPWILYAFLAFSSICTAIQIDSYLTVTYQLVSEDRLPRANALGSLTDSLPQMLCPALGALIFFKFGLIGAFALDTLTFLISTAAVFLVILFAKEWKINTSNDAALSIRALFPSPEAIKATREFGWMRYLISYTLFKYILFASVMVFLVPFVSQVGLKSVGMVLSGSGIAMVAASSIGAMWPSILRKVRLIYWDCVFLLPLLGFHLTDDILQVAALIATSFFGLRMGVIKVQQIWYDAVPSHLQGRLFAARNLTKRFALMVTYVSIAAGTFLLTEIGVMKVTPQDPSGYSIGYIAIGFMGIVLLSILRVRFVRRVDGI